MRRVRTKREYTNTVVVVVVVEKKIKYGSRRQPCAWSNSIAVVVQVQKRQIMASQRTPYRAAITYYSPFCIDIFQYIIF